MQKSLQLIEEGHNFAQRKVKKRFIKCELGTTKVQRCTASGEGCNITLGTWLLMTFHLEAFSFGHLCLSTEIASSQDLCEGDLSHPKLAQVSGAGIYPAPFRPLAPTVTHL